MSPTIIWAIFGFCLLIVEIFTLSFVCLFFGLAAIAVACLRATLGFPNLSVEIITFAVLGGACLLAFRDKLLKNFGKSPGLTTDAHQTITLTADIAPHKAARVEYQGTNWDAHNDSDTPLRCGDTAVIAKTKGIKLILRPKDPD